MMVMDWAVDTTDLVTDVFGGVKRDQFAGYVGLCYMPLDWTSACPCIFFAAHRGSVCLARADCRTLASAAGYLPCGWHVRSNEVGLTAERLRCQPTLNHTQRLNAVFRGDARRKLFAALSAGTSVDAVRQRRAIIEALNQSDVPSLTTIRHASCAVCWKKYKLYVGPPYYRVKMYAGRVACCSLVSHGQYADGTDRRTDARPLHYAFRWEGEERKELGLAFRHSVCPQKSV